MPDLFISAAELAGRGRVDIRVRAGRIVEVGAALLRDGEPELTAGGGAVVPGLHDHHVHLLALAADLASVRCSPTDVAGIDALAHRLRAAAGAEVRATGYHETVAGPLDRDVLDAIVADRPVRVQHRSGAAWFLNSAALAAHGLLDANDPGVERDEGGRATGRLFRGDQLLRRSDASLPDLAEVGRLLAAYGVTGVTDATPSLDGRALTALRRCSTTGDLPQRLVLLGAPLDDPGSPGVPWKIVLDEAGGLDPAAITDEVAAAHAAGRPVAMHAVTVAEAVVATHALGAAGRLPGDRIEHGGLLPAAMLPDLAALGVTVVTQPNFVGERGDDYLREVDAADVDDLYRCGSLAAAGIAVAAGTDAPFGRPDPWAAIAAAVTRRTRSGTVLGAGERLPAARALALFLGPPLDPGGPVRAVAVGTPADLCVLRGGLDDTLRRPSADRVAATVIGGAVVHRADDLG